VVGNDRGIIKRRVSPVGGVAVRNNLPVNVKHSINDFHHQRRNL